MTEQGRQALAVAENLGRLARLQSEQAHYQAALALYGAALEWARRVAQEPAGAALLDQLTRERALARQQEAVEQALVAVTVG